MVEGLFLAVPRGSLQFVIVVFPDHTHLLFMSLRLKNKNADQTGMMRRLIELQLFIRIGKAAFSHNATN